ncbi:hypothetical protein V8B55DRAFT_1594371 [Mucor lusitanicus]
MMEQTSVASSSSSQTSPTDKKAKVWIDKLEDLQICESYCHVSFNSEEGTKKSGKEFWTQVCNHFMKNIVHKQCTLVDRTWDSLKARWLSHIQKNVSKFAGCLTKCIKKNASGSNIGFDVKCYDYLSEKSERWAAILNENASDKETLDDETADAIARADHSFRPIGNKKALAQKRKREAIVIDDDGEEIDPIEALIKETKKLNDRAEERAAKIAKHLQEDQEILHRFKEVLLMENFGG